MQLKLNVSSTYRSKMFSQTTSTTVTDMHLLPLENGQALEQDPNSSSPAQHQAALSHATHTKKNINTAQYDSYRQTDRQTPV